ASWIVHLPKWLPQQYGYALWGCQVNLEFPVVKLLDYEPQWEHLNQSTNPFAVMIMAHLKTQATRQEPQLRFRWKTNLVKGLYEKGYSRSDILELFRFINWMMVLPEILEREFEAAIAAYEEEQRTPYITDLERNAIQRGVLQGIEQGIEQGILQQKQKDILEILQLRFGQISQFEDIAGAITQIDRLDTLNTLFRQAISVPSLETFQTALAAAQTTSSESSTDEP
ncbi:MAG: transposase, partial [Cyanothece sp. SIO1E1]|nr:transposase [Cyanothece sp. SIO1E1]